MFNSLNKKYLLPRLLGQSTAQIKVLKNKNSNYSAMLPLRTTTDPLNYTFLTAKPLLTTQSDKYKSATPKERTHDISNPNKRPKKASVSISTSNLSKNSNNNSKQPSFGKGHELQQLGKVKNIKSNVSIINQITNFNINSKLVKRAELCASHTAYNSNIVNPSFLRSSSSISQQQRLRKKNLSLISTSATQLRNFKRSERGLVATTSSIISADNKRFLFLYFILPIFFTTLKNIAVSTTTTTTRGSAEKSRAKAKLKNLNNQKKQLRSLIKLMLNSVLLLRSSKLAKVPTTNKATPIYKRHTQQSTTKGKVALLHSSYTTALELLKWSVLFIGQSLAPLKKKQEYYSLIFIKILEARGFLALNNKNNLLRYAAASLPKNNVAELSGRNNKGKSIAQKKELTRAKKTIQYSVALDKNKPTTVTHTDYPNRQLLPKTAYPSWKQTQQLHRPSIANQKRVGNKVTSPTALTVDAVKHAQRPEGVQRNIMTALQNKNINLQAVLMHTQKDRLSKKSSTLTALTTLAPRSTINKITSKKVKGKNNQNTATNSVLSYGSQTLQLLRSSEAKKQIGSTDLDTEYTNTNKLGLITFYPGGRNISD